MKPLKSSVIDERLLPVMLVPLFLLPLLHPMGLVLSIALALILVLAETGIREGGVLLLMMTLLASTIKTSPLNIIPDFLDLTVISFALFLGVAVVYVLFKRWTIPRPILLDVLFALFILIVGLQYFHAPHGAKVYALFKLTRFLFLAAPFYIIPRLLTREDFDALSRWMAIVGSVVCVGLFLAFPDLQSMKASGSSYLTIAAGAGVVMLFCAVRFVREDRLLWRLFFLVGMMGALILVFKTNSRGGQLFAPLVLSLYLMYVFRHKRLLVVFAAVLLVTVTLVTYAMYPDFFERFLLIFKRHKGSSISTRFVMYRVAWNLLTERFFTGIGLGGFSAYHFLLYPHNLFLEIFLEHGLFGGLAFCGVLAGAGLRWVRQAAAGALNSSGAPYLLSALFIFLFQMTSFGLESTRLFFFFLGCVISLSLMPGEDPPEKVSYQQIPSTPDNP